MSFLSMLAKMLLGFRSSGGSEDFGISGETLGIRRVPTPAKGSSEPRSDRKWEIKKSILGVGGGGEENVARD